MMPFFFEYLLKVSFVLALMFLFYQAVLRKLTFYNWNRWYLLGYSVLAFLIPFMNITDFLFRHKLQQLPVVQMVPSFSGKYTVDEQAMQEWTMQDILWIVFAAGVLFMMVRLIIQVMSLYRLHTKATLLHEDGMKLFHVDAAIIPFSFHNAIYINRNLHNSSELEEIIKHEFVHIKQKHSIDIFIGELLCIVLWFNPFAWLMRRAMRQNLEFIADHNVLQNGMDKKQYQYLLLKVMGNQQFSVTANFNFSSLKNRITMMNKIKSARMQVIRFLFVLPLVAAMLLAFREKINNTAPANENDHTVTIAGMVVDADTYKPVAGALVTVNEKNISVTTDERGYYKIKIPFENKPLQFSVEVEAKGYTGVRSKENWGNFYETHIYQSYGKAIEFFGLSQKPGTNCFSTIAGNSLFEEGLDYSNVLIALEEVKKQHTDPGYWTRDSLPDHQLPVNVRQVEVRKENGENKIIIKLKNGNIEAFDLKDPKQKELFEKKYGYGILPPPPPSAVDITIINEPTSPVAPEDKPFPDNVKQMKIEKSKDINQIIITLKNGKKETYNLNNTEEKAAFEKKYGELKEPSPPPAAEVPVDLPSPATAPWPEAVASGTTAPTPPSFAGVVEVPVAAPPQPVALNNKGYYLSIADDNGECIVIVKDRNKKIVEAVKFTEWNANEEKYEKKYGKVPPPPPPTPAPASVTIEGTTSATKKPVKLNLYGNSNKLTEKNVPLYVVDGVVVETDVIANGTVKPENIESINVLKGNTATTLYGAKGVNGVIEINTKNTVSITKVEPKLNITTKGTGGWPSGALYMINGKEVTEKEAKELNTDLISSISVLKGESAIKAYGEKGRNGVISIITKTKAATMKTDVKDKVILEPL